MSEKISNIDLSQFTGTENYWSQPQYGKLHYTDGVKYLCDAGACWWLLDLIASYQPTLDRHADARLRYLQFWKLTVNADRSAVVTCVADSGEAPAVEQRIEWTDFPLDEVSVWVGEDVLGMVAYLASEH